MTDWETIADHLAVALKRVQALPSAFGSHHDTLDALEALTAYRVAKDAQLQP